MLSCSHMNIQKIAHVFAPLLLACMCCVAAHGQQQRVEGIVLDQFRAPVAGAKVFLKAQMFVVAETVTDTGGRFAFNSPPLDGELLIVVEAEGFARIERRWTAVAAVAEQGAVSELVLDPAGVSDEVVVTAAARTETRLGETAASVVTLSAAELAATAALTLDDALRQVPGFQLFRRSGSRTANPTAQGVSLRGVGASGTSRALVLYDGVPLNDPFGGWVHWSRVPRAAVGGVEVLRGGASGLYGSGALGGVVSFAARGPVATTTPIVFLESSYGNQRTPDATLFAGGRAGAWGASVAAEAFTTDGYVIVAEQERGLADTPAGARHTSLELTLERSWSERARVFGRGSWFGEARQNGTPLQTNGTHLRQFTIGGEWQTARSGALTFRAYGGTQVYDQTFSAIAPNRNSETLTRVQRVPSQNAGFSVLWSRAIGKGQTLVAGAEAREVRGASDEVVYASGGRAPVSLVGAGGREKTAGFFIEDIFNLTTRLTISAVARVDRWRNYEGRQDTRPLAVRGGVTTATTINTFPDRDETAFSPQLAALYRASERVALRASFNRAFRAPTLNELYRGFRVGDVLTLANENLRAERLTGGEVGANFTSSTRQYDARATAFWSELSRPVANVTLNIAPALITRQRQNLGRTRSRGLELEVDWRPSDSWAVSGGYLLVDATVTRFPVNPVFEGLRIPQVPRYQYSLQARYAGGRRWILGVQARGSGAQFDDEQNRLSLGRYFSLDALASRRLARRLEMFVAAENLLNRRYAVGRTPIMTIGPPLLARFGFRLTIGGE